MVIAIVLKQVLPRRIIRLRRLLGLTQQGLAKVAGVALSTLNGLESGMVRDVKISTVLKLASALHTTPGTLLGFDEFAVSHREGCCICAAAFGAPHDAGECMRRAHRAGRSAEWIAATFGLSAAAVVAIVVEDNRSAWP